jgi:hypothetical protein
MMLLLLPDTRPPISTPVLSVEDLKPPPPD